MLHEERTANILINKAGGNAGPDAKGYRVALPSAWMKALGISEGSRTVTLVGVQDMILVETPDSVMLCPKEKAQDVKKIVDALKAAGRTELL